MQASNSHDISNPPKCFPQDIPPLPKCFLHLINNRESEINLEEHFYANPAGVTALQNIMLNHVDSEGATTIPECSPPPLIKSSSNSPTVTQKDTDQLFKDRNVDYDHCLQTDNPLKTFSAQDTDLDQDAGKRQLLGKLNSSLSKLKKEMIDLRTLDVSLFFQLLSLHEAIQDFKMSVGDRFSETGSEYSLGSASYMGSLSSLSEEDTDWLEGLQSQSSGKGLEDSQVFENSESASSLLDQITALVEKADADF